MSFDRSRLGFPASEGFHAVSKPSCDLLTLRAFEKAGVPHGFTFRRRRLSGEGSPLAFGKRDREEADRRDLVQALGIRGMVSMRQVHGNKVSVVRSSSAEPPIGDGLVTGESGLALMVATADCVPLLLWDERRNVVGAVHAGWRGSLAGIAAEAVTVLAVELDARPESIRVAMGPAIGPCCYEVGEDVVEAFRRRFAGADEFLSAGPGEKKHLDLVAVNRSQLVAAGVPGERIHASGLCTSCHNQDLYSYRKEGRGVGRLMGVVALPLS